MEGPMKTMATALCWLTMAVWPTWGGAQTLAELQHPLLAGGKWAFSTEYEAYGIEYGAVDLSYGRMTYYRPQQVLFPQIAVGLTKNVQLKIDGTYQFPMLFSHPVFDPSMYIRDKTAIRSLTAEAVFRPNTRLEVSGSFLWGRTQSDSNYARSASINALVTEHYKSNILSVHATWLSSTAGGNSRLRSDLDGLHHPLLTAHHWKIDGEFLHRSYGFSYHETDDASPDYLIQDVRSADTRLWLAVTHGITGRLQVRVDGYWHPPFTMTDTERSLFSGWGSTGEKTEDLVHRYRDVYGLRLNARWRVWRQAEAFVEGRWDREKIADGTASSLGPARAYPMTTIRAGGTWLSRPPRKEQALTADLPGLYHPLLEPLQVKVDGIVDHRHSHESIGSPEYWHGRLQATMGLSSSLQARGYGGVLFSTTWLSPNTFERRWSAGAELTLRLKRGVEVYAAAELQPASFFDDYPPFILGRDDAFTYYDDFLNRDFGGSRNARAGVRVMF
jgi:hypothetical protein